MGYLRLWLAAYINPIKFADELKMSPAPSWGFLAAMQRGLMDSLLIYLPVHLLGKVPPTPSNIDFIPTERYYGALIIIGPIVLLAEWLLSSSANASNTKAKQKEKRFG
jgi:hypothetical protein